MKSIRVGCKLALGTCGHVCQDPVSLFHLGSFVDSLSDTVTSIFMHILPLSYHVIPSSFSLVGFYT